MIVDGFFDWAVQEPGPPERSAYFGNVHTSLEAIIGHSLEGWHLPNGYRVYEDPDRFPTGWHGTNGLDGTLYQHYDYRLRLQHAHAGNVLGPGWEAEGFAGNVLTVPQQDTFLHIVQDIEDDTGRKFTRANGGLKEHNEVANGQTQCPSGRYDGLWKRLEEPVGLKEQMDELNAAVMMREDLRAVASGDYQKMVAAHKTLKEKNLI